MPDDHTEGELLRRLHDPRDVQEQRHDEDGDGAQDRGSDDAVGLRVERGGDRTEAVALQDRVDDAEQRRASWVDGEEDGDEERSEAGKPEPAWDRDRRVAVAAAEIGRDRRGGRRPAPRAAPDEHEEQEQRLDRGAADGHGAWSCLREQGRRGLGPECRVS